MLNNKEEGLIKIRRVVEETGHNHTLKCYLSSGLGYSGDPSIHTLRIYTHFIVGKNWNQNIPNKKQKD